jgi:hypothetical protein
LVRERKSEERRRGLARALRHVLTLTKIDDATHTGLRDTFVVELFLLAGVPIDHVSVLPGPPLDEDRREALRGHGGEGAGNSNSKRR